MPSTNFHSHKATFGLLRAPMGPWGRGLLLLAFFCLWETQGQVIDRFSGHLNLTNNGISPIPSFSLGDPALIVDLSFGKRRFSWDPEISMDLLELKPWGVVLPVTYQAVQSEEFNLYVGGQVSVNFQTEEVTTDGVVRELIESRRFMSLRAAPTFTVTKNWIVGFFYLRGFGFDEGAKRAHFLSFSSTVSRLRLTRYFYLTVRPQVFHLRVDDEEGYYNSIYAEMNFADSPFSIGTTHNFSMGTEISPEQNYIWNVSLIYTINTKKSLGRTEGDIERIHKRVIDDSY